MKKKIAILGSSSFLAKEITKHLIGNSQYQLSFFSKSNHDSTKEVIPYIIPNTDIRQDLLSYNFILYCSSAGLQPGHSDSTEVINQVNYLEPQRIINYLIKNGYNGTFISFGSYFEIGINTIRKPFSEIEIINHTNKYPNTYCEAKHQLTKFIDSKVKPGIKFNLLHFIITNMYGYGENVNRLIPYLINGIKTNQSLKLTSGHQVRQYTHVKDIAGFVAKAMNSPSTGIYNISDDETITIRELVHMVLAEANMNGKSQVEFGSVQKYDTAMDYIAVNSSKARSELGWNTRITLKEGIAEYFKSNS